MRIGYHFDLTRDALKAMKHLDPHGSYFPQLPQGLKFSQQAIELALLGNAYTDIFQEDEAMLLMDNSFCRVAKRVVKCCHYGRLIDPEQIEVYTRILLKNTLDTTQEAFNQGRPIDFMLALGTALHIVQDIYAHSNWVELNVSSYADTKDTTFFEVLDNPTPLEEAIDEFPHVQRYPNNPRTFHCHGGSGIVAIPNHDQMHKDSVGYAHYEWAHRAAFKASCQLILMVCHNVAGLPGGSTFLQSLRSNILQAGQLASSTIHGHSVNYWVSKATDFDEGTIRWMMEYAGSWKRPKRWSDGDMFADDMPNVPGIGVLEQDDPYPLLGMNWIRVASEISDRLFRTTRYLSDRNKEVALGCFSSDEYPVVNLVNSVPDDQLILETDGISISDDRGLDLLAFEDIMQYSAGRKTREWNALVDTVRAYPDVSAALAIANGEFIQTYDDKIRWLRLGLPRLKDLETGEGSWNVNNEEVAGEPDYWAGITITELDTEDSYYYAESEYTDDFNPYTNWQVLKPLFSTSPVEVKVEIWESDPSDHRAEKMDLTQGWDTLLFDYDPGDNKIFPPSRRPDYPEPGLEWYETENGLVFRSRGESEGRVEGIFSIGMMSDHKVEVAVNSHHTGGGKKRYFKDVTALAGPRGWRLEYPDRGIFEDAGPSVYTFTFDPGPTFTSERMQGLRLGIGEHVKPASLDGVWFLHNRGFAEGTTYGLTRNTDKSGSVLNITSNAAVKITARETEQDLEELVVILHTAKDAIQDQDRDIRIRFFDINNNEVGQYKLINFTNAPFQPGRVDYFWLGRQHLDGYDAERVPPIAIYELKRFELFQAAGEPITFTTFEIYANGKLLYNSQVPLSLTTTTPVEKAFHLPKEIKFLSDPQVECLGIQDIPGENAKGIAYEITVELEMYGFGAAPTILTHPSPDNPYIKEIEEIESERVVNDEYAKCVFRAFINRHLNRAFKYDLRIDAIDSTGQTYNHCDIELPEPTFFITETYFKGGNRIHTDEHGRKVLHYQAGYQFTPLNWGYSDPKDFHEQHRLSIGSTVLDIDSPLSDFRFAVPAVDEREFPYVVDYLLQVRLKDKDDVWLEDRTLPIHLPKLSAYANCYYQNKVRSWFRSSGSGSIIEIATSDPEYESYATSEDYREIYAEYGVVKIVITPILTRDGEYYADTVFDPQYEWTIPDHLIPYKIKDQDAETSRLQPVFLTDSQQPTVPTTDPKQPETFQRPTLNTLVLVKARPEGPSVFLDLSAAGIMNWEVKCKVSDAIGQETEVKISINRHGGDPNWLAHNLTTLHYREFLAQYAEHFEIRHLVENGWTRYMDLTPGDIDPSPIDDFEETEKKYFSLVQRLCDIYNTTRIAKINESPDLVNKILLLNTSIQEIAPEVKQLTSARRQATGVDATSAYQQIYDLINESQVARI